MRLFYAVIALACGALGCGASDRASPSADAGSDAGAGGADAAGDARAVDAGDPPLCVNGASVDGAYPKRAFAVALGATLPDLSFDGLADDGTPAKIALHDYFEPCAPASRLLVVRTSGAWCGTCRWHAAHTGEVNALDVGPRVRWLDLLVAGEDGLPASAADLPAWRARVDAPGRIGADPAFSLGPVLVSNASLPLLVLVDTRTMKVAAALSDPNPEDLATSLRTALAALDGAPRPAPLVPQTYDGILFRNQWDMIKDTALPRLGAPPADPTNAKADDPAAAALGAKLFADGALSPSGAISCATCHLPTRELQDGVPQSHDGVAVVDRNAPSLLFAAWNRWQFWDGRADTLWSQALGPIENAKEFGSSRLFVDHVVYAKYQADYQAVFGPLPPLSDSARFPASGKPGDASWAAMTADDQRAATAVFVGVGKAIAAYERTFRAKPGALDAYALGDTAALTAAEKGGLFAFVTLGCLQCHYGPRLTDDAFHATRFPTGRQDGQADRGRAAGIPLLVASEFRADGAFSDAPGAAHGLAGLAGFASDPSMLGAFKTPALRGVAETAPYGHGGVLATLDDVVATYATGGLPASDARAVGTAPPWLVKFDLVAGKSPAALLEALTAEPAP